MGAGKFRVESYQLRGVVRRLKYNGRREFLYGFAGHSGFKSTVSSDLTPLSLLRRRTRAAE